MKLGMCGFTIGAAAYYRHFRVVEVQQTCYDSGSMTLSSLPGSLPSTASKRCGRPPSSQCPASFRPTPDNMQAMRESFAAIERPPGVRLLWEPWGAWPDDTVKGLCDDLQLVHAVDPFVRPSLTPAEIYWRLHGNGSHYASYTDAELRQLWAWLPPDDRDGYVLFNNIPRARDIERFRELSAGARRTVRAHAHTR